MKNRAAFICFTGMDGSGKSTQATSLTQYLNGLGIPAVYVWNRFEPRLMLPFYKLGKLLFFRGKNIRKDYKDFSRTQKRILERGVVARAYRSVLSLDYSLQILFKIRFPLWRGRTVVCDRYVFDSAIDIVADTGSGQDVTDVARRLFRLVPRPGVVFLIDLPEQVAFQRKQDTPSLEYLKERRQLYLRLGKEYNMALLDGTALPADIESRTRQMVEKAIRG